MLSSFDWLRRSRTGTELLAILRCLTEDAAHFDKIQTATTATATEVATTAREIPGQPGGLLGPPSSALTGPCTRCWLYPRASGSEYCPYCKIIRQRGRAVESHSRQALVVWGFVNWLPRQLRSEAGFQGDPEGSSAQRASGSPLGPPLGPRILGAYVHDANHFLLMISRRQMQPWLQELVLYHGTELKGHIQVFPTMGFNHGMGMGDILCRAIQHEAYFPMDRLRIRLYTRAYQVLRPHELDREGLLTFDISELLSLLEMAMVFRSVLHPDEQRDLYELLTLNDKSKEMFYWGRFLGILSQEGKDLINAWNMRSWPSKRVKFFYELTNYVRFQSSY